MRVGLVRQRFRFADGAAAGRFLCRVGQFSFWAKTRVAAATVTVTTTAGGMALLRLAAAECGGLLQEEAWQAKKIRP